MEIKKQVRLNLQPKNEDSKKKMALRIQEQEKKIEELNKKNQKIEKNYAHLYNTIKHNYEISPQKENQVTYEAKPQSNLSIDTKIFKSEEEISFIKKCISNKLYNNLEQNFTFKLLYRATRDGDKAKDFHSKCHKYKNNLVVIKTKDGLRFGGFTRKSWEGKGDKLDKEAFCFSLDKNKIYNWIKGKSSIFTSLCNSVKALFPSFKAFIVSLAVVAFSMAII